MKILVSNAGSTSLKFKLFDMPSEKVLCTAKVERVGSADDGIFSYENLINGYRTQETNVAVPTYTEGIDLFTKHMLDPENGVIETIDEVEAVGFKTVLAKDHIGVYELTEDVLCDMREMITVAPAHNIPYLEAIECFRQMLPDVKFVGSFETAFHATIPKERRIYALPYEWYEKYGIQKMGYHGASHSYVASVLEKLYGTTGRTVSCHLGGSGSLCAIVDGKSVDTTFGLSLQMGLIQSNRVGDMDPYIIKYLQAKGVSEEEIFEAMSKKGGLLGISGVSGDLRHVQEAADKGNERAKLAIDVFIYSIVKYVGAYTFEMGGIDNIAFTGGIGENSAYVRKAVMKSMEFLGLNIDEASNEKASTEIRTVTTDDSKIRGIVIPADEEIVVCRKTYELLAEKH